MAKSNVSTGDQGNLKLWWENSRQYISGVTSELRKVHWPGRTQLIGYTGVVLFSVAIIALIVWLFDTGLSFVLEKLMGLFA